MTRLLATLFANGGWDRLFNPINNGPPLGCAMPPPPLGLGPMPGGPQLPGSNLPTCTKADIAQFLAGYDRIPEVAGYKKMVARIESLDLSKAETAARLETARAAVVAAGAQISFDDVAELLAN